MTEQITEVMTAPDANGHIHAKRSGPKGILPSTWLERTLRIQYIDAYGAGVETSGVLADLYPFGMVVNIKGARTCLSWDAVRVVELVDD